MQRLGYGVFSKKCMNHNSFSKCMHIFGIIVQCFYIAFLCSLDIILYSRQVDIVTLSGYHCIV